MGRRLKRWCARLALGLLVLAVVVFVVGYALRAHYGRVGVQELGAIAAKLDAEEPGWRWEAIRARHRETEPAAESNSAAVVLKVYDSLPPKWADLQKAVDRATAKLPNQRPDTAKVNAVLAVKEPTAAVRELACSLRDMPRGRYPYPMPEFGLSRDGGWDGLPKVLTVAKLLSADAMIASLENDPDRAIEDALAAVNVGRSVGDTPVLLAQLLRVAGCSIGTLIAQRTLAWGVPTKGLAELQEAFTQQAGVDSLPAVFHTERAAFDSLYTAYESGRLSPAETWEMVYGSPPTTRQEALVWAYKGIATTDHAEYLRVMSDIIAAMELPPAERVAALNAIRPAEFTLTRLPLPFRDDFPRELTHYAKHELDDRTRLNAAAAAIACERFRQKFGNWPATLDEIPKDILPVVPTDLLRGTPLQLRATPNGVEVVGPTPSDSPGLQTLFRLYNPDQRGQAP